MGRSLWPVCALSRCSLPDGNIFPARYGGVPRGCVILFLAVCRRGDVAYSAQHS
ncbi:hypothetical protein ACNKHU_25695 [Shigella flexneri]